MSTYDFIVVGAGPAGCGVAAGLARSCDGLRVLLLEAGAENSLYDSKSPRHRFTVFLNPRLSKLYRSEPVASLDNRVVRISQGHGLGGTSNINYMVWQPGARDDMDRMVEITGDDAWAWPTAMERLKQVVNRGTQVPLLTSLPEPIEPTAEASLRMWQALGYHPNEDPCDGKHLGVGVTPLTMSSGIRRTAAELLHPLPPNLEVISGAQVHRVLFSGAEATAVRLINGRTYSASREIILCAGALESPKILLHSGIGPLEQLSRFGISPVQVNNHVGRGYRDHVHVPIMVSDASALERASYFGNSTRQETARQEWEARQTGDEAVIGCSTVLGFFKSEAVLHSPEFEALPKQEQQHLTKETIPCYEVACNTVPPGFYNDLEVASCTQPIYIFLHNT